LFFYAYYAHQYSATATASEPSATRTEKTFVVAHDQLRFNLADRIHSDTDHNQKACATEIE
jgi:hypothetical protein